MPHQPYYETFYGKLAAMVRSIAVNHALHDGNKRLAVTVLQSTLLVNGLLLAIDDEALVAIAERCAMGDRKFEWLAEFLEVWTVHLTQDDEDRVALSDADALRGLIQANHAAAAEIFNVDRPKVGAACHAHARGTLPRQLIDRLIEFRRSPEGQF